VTDPSAEEITRSLAGLASGMHRAFHEEQAHMESLRVCWCDGCVQTGRLTVKVVAHYGQAVLSAARGRSTLAGVDVILVHRMLKNSVPLDEYVLMTDAVRERCEPQIAELASPIDEELEGLGAERLYYVDMAALAEPTEAPDPVNWLERTAFHAALTAKSLPYYVGLKRA
jgi:hypothetical protein